MKNASPVHSKFGIASIIALILIVGLLWHSAKNTATSEAQDLQTKEEFVWRTIDTTSAQENPDGCGYLIERDANSHPELIFHNAFPTKLSRAGVILKYTIVYKKR